MKLPKEIIRIILKKKWFNFRKEYLEKVLSMPTKETFVDPCCSRNTLDFAWFSYRHDNPYYVRHYAFRDITYSVLHTGLVFSGFDMAAPHYYNDAYYSVYD